VAGDSKGNEIEEMATIIAVPTKTIMLSLTFSLFEAEW
jgi:hypothetical protein